MLGSELIPLTAATFAVSKMIARERIGSWVREPFVDDPMGASAPRRSVRRALGELVTCSRCVGPGRRSASSACASPSARRQTATAVFAVAGFNDFAQAGSAPCASGPTSASPDAA